MPNRSQLPPTDRAARSRLMQLLGAGHCVARASLVTMTRTCGKKTCQCAQGQKHVSLYLAARIAGRRQMLYVPPDLEEGARALVDNVRKVDGYLEEMSRASLERFVQFKARRQGRRRP